MNPANHSAASRPSRNPYTRLQAGVRAWWLGRLPKHDYLTLTQRNVYILPTRPGWMLAVTLLVLLVASINYQLNLGYVLTFLLAGSALAAMHIGHANLRGITMHLIAPGAHFAGSNALLDVHLAHTKRSPRYALALAVLAPPVQPSARPDVPAWVWTDVPAQANTSVQLALHLPRRGSHPLPPLTIETRFPLGIFRVWALWRPASPLLVYPAPETQPPPLPPGQPDAQGTSVARYTPAPGEYDGVRPYRRGDSARRVVWKKSTRTDHQADGGLVVRDTPPAQQHELWLDDQHTGAAERELQLSRLCAWVLQAEQIGLDYGLRLGSEAIAPANGPAHQQQCLQALALC